MLVRGSKVMLDSDLADLYGVPTGSLVQAVQRNRQRFPPDFMFQLTEQEVANLKSQSVTSSFVALGKWGGRRTLPYQARRRDHEHCARNPGARYAVRIQAEAPDRIRFGRI